MMEQREKLIELLKNEPISLNRIVEKRADYLLANGVVVLPCRCKECYYNDNGSCDEIIWCNFHDTTMGANDFCKHAKRKGGDE